VVLEYDGERINTISLIHKAIMQDAIWRFAQILTDCLTIPEYAGNPENSRDLARKTPGLHSAWQGSQSKRKCLLEKWESAGLPPVQSSHTHPIDRAIDGVGETQRSRAPGLGVGEQSGGFPEIWEIPRIARKFLV
jgi:hypothetical protein